MTATTVHSETMIGEPDPQVPNNEATGDKLSEDTTGLREFQDSWQRVIDEQLIEWGRDPSLLADEDLAPPAQLAIDRTRRVVEHMMNVGAPPPTRVVPDGDGGINIERRSGQFTESIEIASDGSAEFIQLRSLQVRLRVAFDAGI